MNKTQVSHAILKKEKLTNGSKLQKFLAIPYRYLIGAILPKFINYNEREKEIDLFFGEKMKILFPSSLDIYLFGLKPHRSEIKLTKFLLQMADEEKVFFDIGAHYGFFSRLYSFLVQGKSNVYSFEPSSKSFSILEKNCKGFGNITCFNKLVSDTPGEKSFHELSAKYSEYNSIKVDQYLDQPWFDIEQVKTRKIESISIDHWIKSGKIKAPQIIKIDVEGSEEFVLKGMQETLEELSPTIIMEYLCDQKVNASYERALAILKSKNYKAHLIDDQGNPSFVSFEKVRQSILDSGLDSDNVVFIRSD